MIGTATELPVFFFSQQLITRFGHFTLLVVSFVALAIRLSLLSQIRPGMEHLILGIQSLHGVCFALYWVTIVDLSYQLAPPNLKVPSSLCGAPVCALYLSTRTIVS